MLKKLLVICLFSSLINPFKATIHEILVWDGYMQFMPNDVPSVLLGDTIQWLPLDVPSMVHTITSTNIPIGAAPFDEIWQAPADTFFQYIPQVTGIYQYVCTPHIPMGMVGEFTVTNSTCQATSIDSIDNNIVFVEHGPRGGERQGIQGVRIGAAIQGVLPGYRFWGHHETS